MQRGVTVLRLGGPFEVWFFRPSALASPALHTIPRLAGLYVLRVVGLVSYYVVSRGGDGPTLPFGLFRGIRLVLVCVLG